MLNRKPRVRTILALLGTTLLTLVLISLPVLRDPIVLPGAMAVLRSHLGETRAAPRLVVATADQFNALHLLDLHGPQRLPLTQFYLTRGDGDGPPPFGNEEEPEVKEFARLCPTESFRAYRTAFCITAPPRVWRWAYIDCPEVNWRLAPTIRAYCRKHVSEFQALQREQAGDGRRLRQVLLDSDVIPWCEEFFGSRRDAYVVVYSTVLSIQSAGATLHDVPWPFGDSVVVLMGGAQLEGQKEEDYITGLLAHEITHHHYEAADSSRLSYVLKELPLDDRFAMRVAEVAFNESIAEAVSCCLLDDSWSSEKLEHQLRRLEQVGGTFVRVLYHRLLEYEQNRDKYPTLHDFSDEITAAVIEQAEAMGLWPPQPVGGS